MCTNFVMMMAWRWEGVAPPKSQAHKHLYKHAHRKTALLNKRIWLFHFPFRLFFFYISYAFSFHSYSFHAFNHFGFFDLFIFSIYFFFVLANFFCFCSFVVDLVLVKCSLRPLKSMFSSAHTLASIEMRVYMCVLYACMDVCMCVCLYARA